MHWIAPSEKDTATVTLEKRLWGAGMKCEGRSSSGEVQSVRHSEFGIRHSLRLWIQLFHSALNEKGRAGFVMANFASDARSSEQELRRQLIETQAA